MDDGWPGSSTPMLTPISWNLGSPSNTVAEPNFSCSSQRASLAFRTNQPSPFGTRPSSVRSSGASGTISTSDLLGHVTEKTHAELEIVPPDPLVGRVDQTRSQLGVHRTHREEAVRDGPERVAKPVAVREARDDEGHDPCGRFQLCDERLDRVPERRLSGRARPALRLDPLEVVVALAEHGPDHGLHVVGGIAREETAMDRH